ncbi:MAG: phosphate ABC transporter permease subunit PstC [Syntrophorhabdaceae bacterium]|nr:phosphate ABC transporter permease subunit PstC [Syntrophorhabdaceae bacterium]
MEATKAKEKIIEAGLLIASASSILTTAGIIFVLFYESFPFFKHTSFFEFITEKQWTPLFADRRLGILPLVAGTLLTTLIATIIAIPVGLIVAIYLSEYAPSRLKEILKPILELLAAVPTVVYGYFALLFLTPLLQSFFPDISGFNALSPGIVMGIMIIPYISSLSEDSMKAVPMALKEASYALGATRFQTSIRVVIPAAFSGVASSFLLGISRAMGETMVVAIAAGMMPNLTANPFEPVQTLTSYIVQVSLGDVPHGTFEYSTVFAVGVVLFFMTLIFNILSFFLRKGIREGVR